MKDRFMPYVEVTWEDAHSAGGDAWRGLEDTEAYHKGVILCTTIGVLVKRDKRGTTVACSMSEAGQFGGIWHIPAGMVRKVRRLSTRRW